MRRSHHRLITCQSKRKSENGNFCPVTLQSLPVELVTEIFWYVILPPTGVVLCRTAYMQATGVEYVEDFLRQVPISYYTLRFLCRLFYKALEPIELNWLFFVPPSIGRHILYLHENDFISAERMTQLGAIYVRLHACVPIVKSEIEAMAKRRSCQHLIPTGIPGDGYTARIWQNIRCRRGPIDQFKPLLEEMSRLKCFQTFFKARLTMMRESPVCIDTREFEIARRRKYFSWSGLTSVLGNVSYDLVYSEYGYNSPTGQGFILWDSRGQELLLDKPPSMEGKKRRKW